MDIGTDCTIRIFEFRESVPNAIFEKKNMSFQVRKAERTCALEKTEADVIRKLIRAFYGISACCTKASWAMYTILALGKIFIKGKKLRSH